MASCRVRSDLGGVTWHYIADLNARDVCERGGLPVTSLPRTMFDLAAVLDDEALELALDSALRRKPRWRQWIHDGVLRLGPRRPGAPRLMGMLQERAEVTDSPLELLVRRLVWSAGLPRPQTQLEVFEGGQFIARVDFAWPERGLIIQAQGYQFHHGRQRFELDAKQQSQLTSYGWRVLQPTWQRAKREVGALIEEIIRTYNLPPRRHTPPEATTRVALAPEPAARRSN